MLTKVSVHNETLARQHAYTNLAVKQLAVDEHARPPADDCHRFRGLKEPRQTYIEYELQPR